MQTITAGYTRNLTDPVQGFGLWRWLVPALVVGVSLLACGCTEPNLTNDEVADLKIRAQELIDAVEEYHLATGVYPDTIDDLIPGVIPEIPLDALGRPFGYTTVIPPGDVGTSYDTPCQISFNTRENAGCTFLPSGRPRDGGPWWECFGGAGNCS